MSVNVDRHKDALVKAWRQVMDEKDPTNWALFGYEGQTNDLVVVSTGDGGPEELADEFNSGKIMYALCKVSLKDKNVDKVALINWQGEGAPLSRKGTCANHIGTVKLFFKGHHVTISARTDEDVEPDVITEAVAKAVAGEGVRHSGNYEPQAPVGTVYKKVNPKDEINVSAKEEFWKQQEQEDERHKREQQNHMKKFSQNEVKLLRRESQEYFNDRQPEEKTTNGNAADVPAKTNGDYVSTAEAVRASVQKRDSTSGDLVRQRVKTFDVSGSAPVGPGGFNGSGDKANGSSQSVSVLKRRQMFEGGAMNSTVLPATSTIVKRNPAQEIKEAQALAEKEKSKLQQNGGNAAPQFPGAVPKVVPKEVPVPTATTNTTFVSQPAKSPTVPTKVITEAPQVNEIAREKSPDVISAPPQFSNQFRAKSPEVATKPKSPIPVRVSPVPPKPDEHHYDEPPREEPQLNGSYNGQEFEQEDSKYPDLVGNAVDRQEATSPAFEVKPDMGMCARALYDYQAADDSEISFDPGEVITNIEQIDEGWWEGMGPHGVYGLFPANYVELIN